MINAAEKGAALTLSGSTSGVEAGQTVTVTFGGKNLQRHGGCERFLEYHGSGGGYGGPA
ncbi:RTX family exoprotein [Escherichia coli]|uniref:RTX family exoprotein n=1 Tax=Escherichia coli TaxID=562 RepID=A0A376VMY4_ECOLX|nr:RTX family exoprotein [Escherichia coli]